MPSFIIRRSRFMMVVIGLLLITGMFYLPAANAEESVTINQLAVNKQNVFPGETVRVTINWTNETGLVVAATVNCTGGSTTYSKQVNLGPSGTAQVDFPIDYAASTGDYRLTVVTGDLVMKSLSEAFRVNEIFTDVKDVRPSGTAPVEVYAGDNVNVNFKYTAQADTRVKVAVGSLVSKTINLTKSGSYSSTGTSLTIPEGAMAGVYNLRLTFEGSNTVYTETRAIRVNSKPTVELNLTSPTRSNPVVVRPGDSLTVKYNYKVTNDTPVYVRVVNSNNSVLISREVTLSKSKTSDSTGITIPSAAAAGKYSVIVLPKAGGGALDTEQEAVLVENKVAVNITSPTRTKPVTVTGGDKVTLSFNYTADIKSPVEIVLQQSSSDVLLVSSVSLDRTTSGKSRSVSITIPSSTKGGKYDLIFRSPISGKSLDTEEDAVIVDAKVNAAITSPTRSDSSTVKSGGSLTVKFNYISNAASGVDVKVVKSDGKVLASTNASLDKATTRKSKTVSISIPSSATLGKYDVVIASKYSGKVLDTQTQAVVVEDPVTVKVQSPTASKPVQFNTTGKVEVRFNYTALASDNAEFRLLNSKGKVLASKTAYLSRTSRSESATVTISLPQVTPAGRYDLEVRNKDTGNRVALESQAVSVVSYPLNMQVKFIVDQSGRWVNGVFQPTDLNVRVVQNRTLLPIRHVGEPLGWELEWDERNKMATVIKGERQVRVWLNNSNGKVSTNNGQTWKTVKIDPDNASVQPLIVSGRVLLPLRFVSEALDTRVDWDAASRAVIVSQ